MCILMAGMVFVSNGFPPGTSGYSVLTWGVAVVIVASTGLFAALVASEVYRAVRYHKQHLASRNAELERLERAVRGGRRYGVTCACLCMCACVMIDKAWIRYSPLPWVTCSA